MVLRGNALAGLRSFDDALESIEQAIKLDPDRGATYTNLGLLELAKGRREQAEAALVRAVSLSPKDPRPRLALGNFYWATDRTRDAEQQFDAALQLEPANLAANRFMASLKFLTGRRAEAEPYLRRIADSSKGVDGTLALADYYLITARPQGGHHPTREGSRAVGISRESCFSWPEPTLHPVTLPKPCLWSKRF